MVRRVHAGPLGGLLVVVVLLGALAGTGGLTAWGWLVGIGTGVVLAAGLARVVAAHRAEGLGPADWVTLTRATLAAGVAALAADAFDRPSRVAPLVGLAAAALVLDGVDGYVARRTDTASPLGARFDMEVDAFLILVLSVFVARSTAVWVLAIGLARYAFLAAGWMVPWLSGPLPPRFWRKVVAATQGVVLTVAAAQALPSILSYAALSTSLGLLAESFGRDVLTLWRGRHASATVSGVRVAATAVRAEAADG